MKQISSIAVVAVVAVVAALLLAVPGCRQTDDAGEAIATLTELTARMCRCTSKACIDGVVQEMARWGQQVAKTGGDKAAVRTGEDDRRLKAVTGELIACERQALAAAAAGPDSAATGPAGGTTPADVTTGTGGGSARP